MSACEEVNKYGLYEYSFEIGPMDDSSETVAIVGLEYSSVSEYEKFYSKEDVDAVLAEKDRELRHGKYKRCVAIAKWCYDRWIRAYQLNKIEKTRFYVRWHKRWLQLAEQVKTPMEAK